MSSRVSENLPRSSAKKLSVSASGAEIFAELVIIILEDRFSYLFQIVSIVLLAITPWTVQSCVHEIQSNLGGDNARQRPRSWLPAGLARGRGLHGE